MKFAALAVAGRAEGLNAGVTAGRTDPRVADWGGVETDETARVAMAGLEQRGEKSVKRRSIKKTEQVMTLMPKEPNKTE